MEIENSVSNDFSSTFVDSMNVFDCRLSGVILLNLCLHFAVIQIKTWRHGRIPGGYSHFFFIRRFGPSIICLPNKTSGISSTPKISCTFTLRKDPKIHRNDP